MSLKRPIDDVNVLRYTGGGVAGVQCWVAKREEMYKIQQDPVAANFLIVKNGPGLYEWWFNYHFNYGSKLLDSILENLPPALSNSSRQLTIHMLQHPPQGYLPCIYIGDGSATEQTILKQARIAKGSFAEIWPIFEAYARML